MTPLLFIMAGYAHSFSNSQVYILAHNNSHRFFNFNLILLVEQQYKAIGSDQLINNFGKQIIYSNTNQKELKHENGQNRLKNIRINCGKA